jgi:pimeloyl-ACP methyl ester carboxylesterase
MPHVNSHGIGLYYEAHGDGEPLVFLHNGLGCTKSFAKQVHEFSEHFKVITYDRYGFGRSTHMTALKEAWLQESVEELSCFLNEIRVDRAHFCGICVGGAIALLFAAQNPLRVGRVTVAGTCCFGEEKIASKALKLYPRPEDLPDNWAQELADHHGATYARNLYRIFYQAIREENGYPFKGYDLRPILPSVRSPVLVIYGDRDGLFDLEQALAMCRHLPNAHLCIIPNCGHLPNEERHEDFNREALGFLRGGLG